MLVFILFSTGENLVPYLCCCFAKVLPSHFTSPKMFHLCLSISCVFHVHKVMLPLPRIFYDAPVTYLTPPSWCTAEGAVLVDPGGDRSGMVWLLWYRHDRTTKKRISEIQTDCTLWLFFPHCLSMQAVNSSWHTVTKVCRKLWVILSHIFVQSRFISSTSVIAFWYNCCFMCPQMFSIGIKSGLSSFSHCGLILD